MNSSVDNSHRNFSDLYPILYQNRHCDQEDFGIAVVDGSTHRYCDKPYVLNNFDTEVHFTGLLKQKSYCKADLSISDSYVAYRYKVSSSSFVMESTSLNIIWKCLLSLKEERINYCILTFMDKLFIVGGKYWSGIYIYSKACMFYDKQTCKWYSTAVMIEGREKAACTVFEGKIVVSGGSREIRCGPGLRTSRWFNSVEAYDHYDGRWSSFPRMLSKRRNHAAVSIGNKLFMIGGCADDFNNCEVFESVTRNFTSIESLPKWTEYLNPNRIVCVGYKIYFYLEQENNDVHVHTYDVNNNLFSFKTSLNFGNIKSFRCFKI